MPVKNREKRCKSIKIYLDSQILGQMLSAMSYRLGRRVSAYEKTSRWKWINIQRIPKSLAGSHSEVIIKLIGVIIIREALASVWSFRTPRVVDMGKPRSLYFSSW